MTYSLKVCAETEELFLVLVKQQLHELLVDRLQLLVGVQRGEQILPILVDDLQDHQTVVGIVLIFPYIFFIQEELSWQHTRLKSAV